MNHKILHSCIFPILKLIKRLKVFISFSGMAKWGQGDPRWIVEERDDAKNVNNWHWSEKNATQWSKDRIKKLLTGLVVETENCKCTKIRLEI